VKIHVDRLKQEPVNEVFEAPASWWLERTAEAQAADYEILTPFRFELRSYKAGADVIFEGACSAEIEVECGRCLARYRHALHDQFRLVAEDARGRVPPDPEGCESLERDGLCLTDEIESGWYRGSVIQLDGLFSELIAGTIPDHPVCRESCRGLCRFCGKSLNDENCDCDSESELEQPEPTRKSPFAVLARLRDESAGGN